MNDAQHRYLELVEELEALAPSDPTYDVLLTEGARIWAALSERERGEIDRRLAGTTRMPGT